MSPEDDGSRSRMQQFARLGELLAGLAHEVRNPLSTVLLNLQLIREEFDADPDGGARERRTVRRLAVVEDEVKRLQALLDEFLRFARMPDVAPEPSDVNGLLRAVVEFSAPELAERGISLRFYPGQDVGTAPLDPAQFRAAVVNLVRNAADACKQGDEVIVSSRRLADGHVQVQVIDTGEGMDEETIQRIFQPYFSTKKAGTGLGLPTVRRILEQHGGSVRVQSEVGRGTQFTLELPPAAE